MSLANLPRDCQGARPQLNYCVLSPNAMIFFSTSRIFLPALTALALLSPLSAAEESVAFNQTKFFLRFAPEDSPVKLREYLPAGETLEKWTQMLSARTFTNLADPKAYALKLAQDVVKGDPAARSQVLQSDKSGTYVVDFLVFSQTEPPFAEWNLMRVDKVSDGLRVTQYARRFSTIDDAMSKAIIAAREKILPQLEKLALP